MRGSVRNRRRPWRALSVIQILAVAVAIRVGNATGNTVLKGAGEHRMLAFVNLGTGVANLVLSIAADPSARPCRCRVRDADPDRVLGDLHPLSRGLPPGRPPGARRAAHSVLPAVWPAFVVGIVARRTRLISSGTLLAVVLQAVGGGVLYLRALLSVAIGRRDRALYTAEVVELVRTSAARVRRRHRVESGDTECEESFWRAGGARG